MRDCVLETHSVLCTSSLHSQPYIRINPSAPQAERFVDSRGAGGGGIHSPVRGRCLGLAYAAAIHDLVKRYRRGRLTVVLLPGGMGSQLDRSLDPHAPGALPPAMFETVWADAGLLFNQDALTLEIDGQGRDRDRHAIVPNGALDFLIRPSDGTEEFAADRDWNFTTFGYDWRRGMREAAASLEGFLLLYKRAVQRRHNQGSAAQNHPARAQPRRRVAKIFLHRITDVRSWIDKAITVGAPFYGTWSHQQRYYVGEQLLNVLHGPPEVARIIGTMPGPYALMFLSQGVFARDRQRLGLAGYPIVEAETGADADPYAPASRTRYPRWVSARHLADAAGLLETIAAPLPAPVCARFYKVRSRLDGSTPTALSWRRIGRDFDPANDPSPIEPTSTEGGGDGTVPAWAAWHAHTPDANRIELAVARDHVNLAEHREVLAIVQGLVEEDRVLASAERPRADALYGTAPAPRSSAQVEAFVRDVRASRATRDDPRASDAPIWRGIYRELKR